MKKIFIIIIIFLITGCNSYTELNTLGVINSIGIEKKDNYKLYASIITNLDNYQTTIYEAEGKNISNLFSNLSLKLNKKIYLSHLDLMIINNSIKTNELKEIINFFINNNDTRNDFLIVTTDNIKNIIEKSKWQEINNQIKINNENFSNSIYTTMFDTMNLFYKNNPIYLTNIKFDKIITINGITKIANNKHTLIDENNTLFINYLLNNINSFKCNLKCSDTKYIYLNIISSNTNNINNKVIITNEINILENDCNFNKNNINKLFNTYLINNLKKYTTDSIIIKNTIRS